MSLDWAGFYDNAFYFIICTCRGSTASRSVVVEVFKRELTVCWHTGVSRE